MAMLCRCLSTCNKTQEKLQTAADVLNDLLKRFGRVISIEKTKTMILNFKGKKEDYPKHLITINNKPVENVTEFIYLGAIITYNEPGTSEKELNKRIECAN